MYSFLPSDVKEQVEYLAYGRNLESVVEAYNESSSLTSALDERASDDSIAEYEKMSTMQYLFGGGQVDVAEGGMLSDYRGMILHIGILGLVLSAFLFFFIVRGTPLKVKIALLFAYFLVLIHRSWMLYAPPHIIFLAFLAVFSYRVYNSKRNSQVGIINENYNNMIVAPKVIEI